MARTIAHDHDAKRAAILDRAAALFAQDGFDKASMSQLAQACGMSKAAIYHYYDSKHALLFDILDRHLAALRDRLAAVSAENPANGEGLVRALILELLLAYRGADDAHRLQTNSMAQLGEAEQERLRGYQREMVSILRGAVAAAAPESLRSDRKALHGATMALFGMLNWFYMWNRDEGLAARQAYARLTGDIFINGIRGM